jgi:lipopolysaccharide heptosyltransferase II
LVIRPDHIGDLLFTTPALPALRAAYPQAHIAALVGPWGADIVRRNPCLDEVITCDFPWFSRRPKASPLEPYRLLWAEARRLRGWGFDLALNLRFDFWWGALLAYLAGIPRRVGYDIAECRPFLTDAVPYTPGRHEVRQNLTLVEHVARPVAATSDAPFGQPPLDFPLSDEERAFARQWLAAHDQFEGEAVAIHPGSGAAVKLWPADRWAAVADALAWRYGCHILLTGSASERSLAQLIDVKMRAQPLQVIGETTLGQLAALFAACRLVLGVDSGPLHLAVAVGAPSVHLCGPVDPALFGPWGDPARHTVVQARYFDQPCHHRPCNRLDYAPAELTAHPCMATIEVAQVLEAAEVASRQVASRQGDKGQGVSRQVDKEQGARRQGTRALSTPPLSTCPSSTILGRRVDDVTPDEALGRIAGFVAEGGAHQVVTLNPEILMASRREAPLAAAIEAAALVVPDGIGLVWASRWLGRPLRQRVSGSDLVPRLAALAAARGWGIFLLGAAPGVADVAAAKLRAANPTLRIAGTYAGSPSPEEEEAIVARIRAAAPQMLFVAYGAPAQDLWIARNLARLGVPVAIGVGGTLDFIAGTRRRAPAWVQRVGLEWLYRLWQEPRRWRRMLALPHAACLVFWEGIGRQVDKGRVDK